MWQKAAMILFSLINMVAPPPPLSPGGLRPMVSGGFSWRPNPRSRPPAPTMPAKPTGLAVSPCITWFQTQLILITCQMRYHSHLWDHRSTGQL